MFSRIDLRSNIMKFGLQKGTTKRLFVARGMAHMSFW